MWRDSEPTERTIPAADRAAGTEFALVRLGWSGKAIGPKNINADLFAFLPGSTAPAHQRLDADVTVVPAFDLLRRDGPNHWTLTHDLPVGDLREDAVSTQQFFIASSTGPTRSTRWPGTHPTRASPGPTRSRPPRRRWPA